MDLNATNDLEHWRKRAEEARAIAVQMTSPHTKAVMLKIAQDYEKLAKRAEERLVRGPRPDEITGVAEED